MTALDRKGTVAFKAPFGTSEDKKKERQMIGRADQVYDSLTALRWKNMPDDFSQSESEEEFNAMQILSKASFECFPPSRLELLSLLYCYLDLAAFNIFGIDDLSTRES